MSTTDAGLAREGYTVLRRFVSASEVASLRREVERLMASSPGSACARPNNTLVPLRWDDPVVDSIVADGRRRERLRRATDARDLRWISGYVSIKDAHSLPLEWHRDWWCWDHPVSYRREPVQVALLCYLSGTDARHGALRVTPGSHGPGGDEQTGEVTLDLQAGDAAVLDYRLLHGTHANAAGRRRDCILLSFTPSWTELPTDIRGHLISHPALPGFDEPVPRTGWPPRLLPNFVGPRNDLPLRRDAPADFAMTGVGAGHAGPPQDGRQEGPDNLRSP